MRRAHALLEKALSAVNLCANNREARKVRRAHKSGCGAGGKEGIDAVAGGGVVGWSSETVIVKVGLSANADDARLCRIAGTCTPAAST